MAHLRQKVRSALRDRFAEAEIKLDRAAPGERLTGTLIWDGFVGQDFIERQRAIREALETALTTEERRGVSTIFTLTPTEIAVMREG